MQCKVLGCANDTEGDSEMTYQTTEEGNTSHSLGFYYSRQ